MYKTKTMRYLFKKVFAWLLLLVITPAFSQEQPNILFCMADDWGWPHAGIYGDEVVKTPAFDRIANEGVLFNHAYISSPSCTPSRNAILTGQQFYRLEQGANLHSILDTKFPNFMMMLKEAGYTIGHHSKAWGPGDYEQGGYEQHPCGPEITFKDFIEEQSEDQPFSFWLGTNDPHRNYEGYGAVAYEDVFVPNWFPDIEAVRKDIASYYYEVQRWDQKVAKAIATLEAAGELENTIIVMTGDHGWPFPRGKGNLYDYGARVPLAIRWGAEVEGGRQVSDFVSLTDLAPTFLEAAGITPPVQMTGRSLVQVIQSRKSGTVDSQRNFVVIGRERHAPAQEKPSLLGYPARAIRTDGWLYIMNLKSLRWPVGVPENATHPMNNFADCDDGPTKKFIMDNRDEEKYKKYFELSFAKRPAEELYDVENDPDQVHNLAGKNEYYEVIQSLRNKLLSYLRKTKDPRFTEQAVKFDDYPYRAEYIDPEKLEKMRKKQTKSKRVEAPF